MREVAFQMEACFLFFFLVINVALELQGVHDAPNFITQEDMRRVTHTQTLNDAQKHSLEVTFWILLGQDNIFLDRDWTYFLPSSWASALFLFVEPCLKKKSKTKQKQPPLTRFYGFEKSLQRACWGVFFSLKANKSRHEQMMFSFIIGWIIHNEDDGLTWTVSLVSVWAL